MKNEKITEQDIFMIKDAIADKIKKANLRRKKDAESLIKSDESGFVIKIKEYKMSDLLRDIGYVDIQTARTTIANIYTGQLEHKSKKYFELLNALGIENGK